MNTITAYCNQDLQLVTEHLEAEIHSLVNDENQEFLLKHAPKIGAILSRFHWRVRRLSNTQLLRLYGELVFELALCEPEMGRYRDDLVLDICLGLRLQRRLERFFRPQNNEDEPELEAAPRAAPPRKPKFRPARQVA